MLLVSKCLRILGDLLKNIRKIILDFTCFNSLDLLISFFDFGKWY